MQLPQLSQINSVIIWDETQPCNLAHAKLQ